MTDNSAIIADLERHLYDIRDAAEDASQAEEDDRPISPAAIAKVHWKDLYSDIGRAIDRFREQ